MLENNNEVLVSMLSKEMGFLLDARERAQEEQFRKLDQLIRQQQNYRKESARPAAAKRLRNFSFNHNKADKSALNFLYHKKIAPCAQSYICKFADLV